jgi:hypothetical protein
MNGLTRNRIVAYLSAVFIAGALAGAAGGYQWGRQSVFKPGPKPPDMAGSMMERFERELALTPEQVGKVQPVVQDAVQRVRSLHRENFKKTDAIMQECNSQIISLLDDDQKARFNAMEERRKKWIKERSGDGFRGRPSGPPPGGFRQEGGHPGGPRPEPGTSGVPRPPDSKPASETPCPQ